jgi:hypothetical protein
MFHRIATGVQIAAGAVGGIYASTTFIQKEAPYYHSGLWATAVRLFWTFTNLF